MPDTATTESFKARGVLEEIQDDRIVLSFPDTSYRLHLDVLKPPTSAVGKPLRGIIRVAARRIDVVHTGGSYIEPVYGEPRRIQGEILSVDATTQTVVVNAGACPIHVKISRLQQAADFKPGDFVSFDAQSGASFIPA